MRESLATKAIALILASALAGCGGGGGSSTGSSPAPTPSASFTDPVTYSSAATASLPSAAEIVSVTRHQLVLGGATLNYTATAGHLTARAPGTGAEEASFFYVAYTLDGRDPATRAVTFFYNGGPGSATVWLHLGSFGPKRLAAGAPSTSVATPFPLVDNAQSLLDVSDLVFVDAIGSGFSQAIAPNINRTFWGVDVDAAAFRDFVVRYVAVNGRAASPKFLFGESYGTTRTAVLARLLESAGVSLKGVVLQSSVLDYNANCGLFFPPALSCGDILPTYGAVGSYFNLAPDAAGKTLADYEAQLRPFAATQYDPAVRRFLATPAAPPDAALLAQLVAKTGMALARWQSNFNMDPTTFHVNLVPGTVLGLYDARVTAPAGTQLASEGDPSSTFITPSFASAITQYLANELGYTTPSSYVLLGNAINLWNFSHDGMRLPDTVPDLAVAFALDSKLKVFSANGYHDLVTPFFVTENDLARLGAGANVATRFYAGGHMTYLDDAARVLERADLGQFYQAALASAAKSEAVPTPASAPVAATVAPRAVAAMPPAVIEVPVRDPWVPPELRDAPRPKASRGASLEGEVEAKLRADFEEHAPRGSLTREEARAAGLGFVAQNFEEIDAARRGSVRFEDLKRFLKERGARLPD